jgi:hypothetical protein
VAQADPERMSIANLRTAEIITAQYNPTEFKRTVTVVYNRLGILGQSHQQLQYQLRENEKFNFTLTFDLRGNPDEDPLLTCRKLDALTVGSSQNLDIAGGGPPDCLFEWPNFLLLVCRITKLEYNYKMFSPEGVPIHFTVGVDLEEARDFRLYAEDVVQFGLQRE